MLNDLTPKIGDLVMTTETQAIGMIVDINLASVYPFGVTWFSTYSDAVYGKREILILLKKYENFKNEVLREHSQI